MLNPLGWAASIPIIIHFVCGRGGFGLGRGRGFGRLGTGSARIAYLQSYAFIEFLGRGYGEGALREYVVEVVRTGDLERSARRVFRASLADLEGRFLAELG